MRLLVEKTQRLAGEIAIPGSKSHTIRAVVIASLAAGTSRILAPLESADTLAAARACEALGANVGRRPGEWVVTGFGGRPRDPGAPLDMANSGTSLNLLMGVCALAPFAVTLDGDESLRSRPVQPLLDALAALGAEAVSLRGNGRCPVRIRGPIRGGRTSVRGTSSQYVSALLLAAPLAADDTEISVAGLREAPYVRMTLAWMESTGAACERAGDLSRFLVRGSGRYAPFERRIPADWSTAAFPVVGAALLPGSDVVVAGLDPDDVQGDKKIVEYVRSMGGDLRFEERGLRVRGTPLSAAELDLDETPDALPALSVLGCAAAGETRLVNVAQARIKETDRITVMRAELARMDADVEELADGLVVRGRPLRGAAVDGHYDHRVVMSLALAGLSAEGRTTVAGAEAVDVTFPEFVPLMKSLGAGITMED